MIDRYEIYGMTGCPYSFKTKELLDKNNLRYLEFKLDEFPRRFDSMTRKLTAQIMKDSYTTGIPLIYYNGDLIGGYYDLKESLNENLTGE